MNKSFSTSIYDSYERAILMICDHFENHHTRLPHWAFTHSGFQREINAFVDLARKKMRPMVGDINVQMITTICYDNRSARHMLYIGEINDKPIIDITENLG